MGLTQPLPSSSPLILLPLLRHRRRRGKAKNQASLLPKCGKHHCVPPLPHPSEFLISAAGKRKKAKIRRERWIRIIKSKASEEEEKHFRRLRSIYLQATKEKYFLSFFLPTPIFPCDRLRIREKNWFFFLLREITDASPPKKKERNDERVFLFGSSFYLATVCCSETPRKKQVPTLFKCLCGEMLKKNSSLKVNLTWEAPRRSFFKGYQNKIAFPKIDNITNSSCFKDPTASHQL